MGAKLQYQDVFNDELQTVKFTSTPFLTGSGSPNSVLTASIGALYMDTTGSNLYLKSTNTTFTGWNQISSATGNIQTQHYRNISITGATTTGATDSPIAGDLVGIYGAGAWAAGANFSTTRSQGFGFGNTNASVYAGGADSAALLSFTQLYNGATWSASGNISFSMINAQAFGSANAGVAAGGSWGTNITTTTAISNSNSETYNGATWAVGTTILSASRAQGGGIGSQLAGVIFGGLQTTSTAISSTEYYNGSVWTLVTAPLSITRTTVGIGTQQAGLAVGGSNAAATAAFSTTEFFNGSTWFLTGNLNTSRGVGPGACGTQLSGLVFGGVNTTGGLTTSSSELFNGSTWTSSGSLSAAKYQLVGVGTQTSAMATAGFTGASLVTTNELHTQITYRKLYPRYVRTAKNIGIASTIVSSTVNVVLQGSLTNLKYPPNKTIVTNRNAMTVIANETNTTTSITVTTILASSGSNWVYNVSGAPNFLNLIPGMMAVVTQATNAGNNGTFVIAQVVTGSDLILINSTGIVENPSAAVLQVIPTLLAVNTASEQDIVIGQTDANGVLTIAQPLIVSSYLARTR